MAWALLAFPAAPGAFRQGLLGIFSEELRHLRAYRAYLLRHGVEYGHYGVRDWFWTRVPQARTPAEFVAIMGLGLEGGNLDHTERFIESFAAIGDEAAVGILKMVEAEEIGHVRFAAHWFRQFTGGLDFGVWRAHLPGALTTKMLRGHTLNRRDRRLAGMHDEFLDRLADS